MLGRKSAGKRASADRLPVTLIVGLGNPGPDYQWTRHNLGFLAIDALAERAGIRVARPEAKSYVGRGEIAGQAVALAKPQTAMNLSGVAVKMLLEKYDSDAARMIVLFDEVDLPWGMLRIRPKGSSGTHNGMKSVIREIGTNDFVRVRLGIGPEKVWGDLKDYVLGKMNRAERETALQMAGEAAEAVEVILADGVEKAMQRFNRRKAADQQDENAEQDPA